MRKRSGESPSARGSLKVRMVRAAEQSGEQASRFNDNFERLIDVLEKKKGGNKKKDVDDDDDDY